MMKPIIHMIHAVSPHIFKILKYLKEDTMMMMMMILMMMMCFSKTGAEEVTISNVSPRRDMSGEIMVGFLYHLFWLFLAKRFYDALKYRTHTIPKCF